MLEHCACLASTRTLESFHILQQEDCRAPRLNVALGVDKGLVVNCLHRVDRCPGRVDGRIGFADEATQKQLRALLRDLAGLVVEKTKPTGGTVYGPGVFEHMGWSNVFGQQPGCGSTFFAGENLLEVATPHNGREHQ